MDEYHAQNDLNQHATVYTGANRVGFEEFEGIETNDDAGCPIGGYAFEGDARDMEVNPHAGHYGSAAESGDENDEDDSGNDEVEHDEEDDDDAEDDGAIDEEEYKNWLDRTELALLKTT
jgi:hypothetical protein